MIGIANYRELFSVVSNDTIIVYMDSAGYIEEAALSSNITGKTDTLLIARDLMRKGDNIRSFFQIPETRKLDSVKSTFPCRMEAFRTVTEVEGFFTELPLFMIRIFPVSDNLLAGTVRQSNFYTGIADDSFFNGYVFVNPKEEIVAYNRIFQSIASRSINENTSLFGRGLRELMVPSPSEVQKQSQLSFKFPETSLMQKLHEQPWADKKELSASSGKSFFFTFPTAVDWGRDDFCVEMDLAEGALPCVVIGDYRKPSDDVTDIDGYLLGVSADSQLLVFKKRTRLMYSTVYSPLSVAGRYRFWRIGNQFVIDKDGQVILYFADYDTIQRDKTNIAIYLRENTRSLIRSLSFFKVQQQKSWAKNSGFVTMKSTQGSFCLVSLVHTFERAGTNELVTIYRLQNLISVKDRLSTLEKEHKEAVEKAKAADMKLRAFLDDNDQIAGQSVSFSIIKEQANKVAPSKATILIQGTTGSGKEVLARHIHNHSLFADGPFVKVDCATLPKTLMESLLFGHEKGAFTGATEKRKGLFEHANGGTIYLDEASNLDLQVQAKLLQFLQDMTVTPVGGKTALKLNTRIIVATNVPLLNLVKQGLFREDLYYRIAVVVLKLPALGERVEDIPVLAEHFISLFNHKYEREVKSISAGALTKLVSYEWPGNIRELKNTMERAFLFGASGEIREEDILFTREGGEKNQDCHAPSQNGRKLLKRITASTDEVIKLFEKNSGVVIKTANELNVTRQTLYNFLKKNNIHIKNMRNN